MSTVRTMTIVDFLRARLDEDEQVALAAESDDAEPWWTVDLLGADMLTETDAAHIAHHSPQRVLREVEAKRRVLDAWPDPTGQWSAEQADAGRAVKDRVYRLLALPYADHPDYDEAWRRDI